MDRSKETPIDRSTTDFLHLDASRAPAGGRTAWLADQLRDAIADGRLPVGSRLPATRTLAADLGVSRGTVTEAYQRLAEGGQILGRGRGGTVVVQSPAPVTAEPVIPDRPVAFGDPGLDVFDDLRAAPARIDLTPGVPDLTAFPRAAWLRAERQALAEAPASSFGYAEPAGVPAFREAVAAWLARFRGMRVGPEEVVVVAGVAQALMILARVLPGRGAERIGVEDPGSFGARRHLESWGLDTVPLRVDDRGLRVDELRASGASAVLVTPAHQFPMGVVLDGSRRRELTAWAGDGGVIIEDDYDAEHRYDRAPVPALQATAPDRTCYAGSLSKILAPALRVGWLVVPPRLRPEVIEVKRDIDLGNATLPQLTLTRLMGSGDLERHLRAVRSRHRRRRDTMIGALRAHLPQAQVHGAAAGLHLVVTLPGLRPGDDIGVATAALEAGVKVQPLAWHRTAPGDPGLVLGYAASTPVDIEAGIAALASAIR